MNIRLVYGVLPAFVTWIDTLPVNNKAGETHKCFITLLTSLKGQEPILQHELQHVRQWYRSFVPWLPELTVQQKEVQAYKWEARFYPEDDTQERRDQRLLTFAVILSINYPFGLSTADALALLKEPL